MSEITEKDLLEFLKKSRDLEMLERLCRAGKDRKHLIENRRRRQQLDDGDQLELQNIIKELAPRLVNYRKKGERLTQGMAERMLHAMAYSLLEEKTEITKAEYVRVMRCGKPDDLRNRLEKAKDKEYYIKFRGALRNQMIEKDIII